MVKQNSILNNLKIQIIFNIFSIIILHFFIGNYNNFIFGYAYFFCFVINILFQIVFNNIISNIVNEYNSQGYYKSKYNLLQVGKKICLICALFFSLLLVVCPIIVKVLFGSINIDDLINNTVLVMIIITSSIIFSPIIGLYQGYLNGHKLYKNVTLSQLLECILVTLFIFIAGMVGKFSSISNINLVYIIYSSFVVGKLVTFLYLEYVLIKKRNLLNKKILKINETAVETKEISKTIYSKIRPYMLFSIFILLVYFIDMFLITNVKTIKIIYYPFELTSIINTVSVWGLILNIIVISTVLLTNYENLKKYFDSKANLIEAIPKLLSKLLRIVLPLLTIVFILSRFLWITFYGVNDLDMLVYRYCVLTIPAFIIFMFSIVIMFYLKENKLFYYLVIAFITKISLNIPLIYAFDKMKFPVFVGISIATIISYIAVSYFIFRYLSKKYKLEYETCIKEVINTLIMVLVISIVLLLLIYIFPCTSDSQIINGLYSILFMFIGLTINNYLNKKLV